MECDSVHAAVETAQRVCLCTLQMDIILLLELPDADILTRYMC